MGSARSPTRWPLFRSAHLASGVRQEADPRLSNQVADETHLQKQANPIRALQLPNGNLLVPIEPGTDDATGEGPFREIGPEHPEYGHWLALSRPSARKIAISGY
jgi:hypothetical protein